MFTELIFIAAILVTLYGLINSTEKVLRQRHLEQDARIIDHRSRL